MEIFLGAETEGAAAGKWFELQKTLTPLLNCLRDVDYGKDLTSIGIITILMRDSFFEDGGYPERRYYNSRKKEADIRLRMDYHSFNKATSEQRKAIYIQHIIRCIETAGEKVSGDFDADRLIRDVKNLLE